MANGERDPESKTDKPKGVRFSVWVDSITSLEDQCSKAGFRLEGIRAQVSPWGKLQTPSESYQVELSDGSDTVGKTWEKVMKGIGKDQRPATIFEGIALVKAHSEILDSRRLAFPATAHDMYDILQIGKNKDGEVVISPLFVGDSNKDHIAVEEVVENGVVVREGMPATRLPFAVIFATK